MCPSVGDSRVYAFALTSRGRGDGRFEKVQVRESDSESHSPPVQMVRDHVPPAAPSGDQLLVVSNREPYEHVRNGDGVEVRRPTGGLATALDALLARTGGRWLAWGSGDADFLAADDSGRVAVPPADPAYALHRLDLRDAPVEAYYEGYSNQVLWPLAHHEPDRVDADPAYWAAYRSVNRRFADAVVDLADRDTVVWFQDYHLALAPRFVRDAGGGDRTLAQFWHVPWPAPSVFADCPHRGALLDGLLANDVLGFHTERYRADFGACVEQFLEGASVDRHGQRVRYRGATTDLVAVPAGIDPSAVAEDAGSPAARAFARSLRSGHDLGDRVAVAVDRLDYTKGVRERLDAFEALLASRPDLRGEVSLVQKCSRTRQGVADYRAYADAVETSVGAVNDRFGTDDWDPVVHLDGELDRRRLAGLYRLGDVCVVSSLRDGLNLVAEEFAIASDDGVLVLGEDTGVRTVLAEGPLVVDPTDTAAFADALAVALRMGAAERRTRLDGMAASVRDHDVRAWMADLFRAIRAAAPAQSD